MSKASRSLYYDFNRAFASINQNIYTVNAVNNLVTWVRMEPSSPADLGTYKMSPAYVGSPSVGEMTTRFSHQITYKSAKFNDAAGQYANVTSTSGRLSFSSAASGGTPSVSTDKSFSIALSLSTLRIS